MKRNAIWNTLRSQMFIGLILFLLLALAGGIFSGALTLDSINFRTVTFHLPLMSVDYTMNPDYGLWVGILATSATLAAFLSNYLGRRSFITYKFVNYPADHLKVMRFIRGNPQNVRGVSKEFDIPNSVAQRVLEDLEKGGLLERISDGDRAIYYFPFEKHLVGVVK
ncbi:MAG: winged helix-turn-helix transcriptional regulator [Candidatus Altiarchaeota archaeon]|nr:winged helix-turn-helix transcriptional regulator [Candidatus Altiarchaeota archaeon]